MDGSNAKGSEDLKISAEDKGAQFLLLFDQWSYHHSHLVAELEEKTTHTKQLEQKSESFQNAHCKIQEECEQLQRTVTHCQQQLQTFSDLEDEMISLKSQLSAKEQDITDLTIQHEADMIKMKEELQNNFERHAEERQSEFNKKLQELETMLSAEQASKSDIEQQLNNSLKEKEREISKLTMEYESKLAAGERQRAQYQQQQQQLFNQDIMRKKMQHMKQSYDREVSALKSQLTTLQNSTLHPTDMGESRPLQTTSPRQQQQKGIMTSIQQTSMSVDSPRQRQPLFAPKHNMTNLGGKDGPNDGKGKAKARNLSVTKRSF